MMPRGKHKALEVLRHQGSKYSPQWTSEDGFMILAREMMMLDHALESEGRNRR